MLNYCIVKQRIGAITEDNPDDDDRYPDYTSVFGQIVFAPTMANGSAYKITDDEGVVHTVPATRINAQIVNGEIVHEGLPGLPLFAAGPNANPSTIVYTATYHNLTAAGRPVTLNNITFRALPGATIDLSSYTPVAGTPTPGIIQGPPGHTPYIGENGNWWINNRDTDVVATSPLVHSYTELKEAVEETTLRVKSLEAMNGVSPESPVDGQTANLVANGDTLTHEAVRGLAIDAAQETTGQKLDFLLSKGLAKNFTTPFDFPLEVEARRDPYAHITTDLDVESLHIPGTGPTIHIDPQNGVDVDVSDGSRETPYKTQSYAGAKNPDVSEYVFISSGIVKRADFSYIIGPGYTVRAESGVDLTIVSGDPATWTNTGEVYQANIATCNGVLDLKGYTGAGDDPKYLTRVDSISQVRNTPGSYHFVDGVVTVQLHDGRAPDGDVYISRTINKLLTRSGIEMQNGETSFIENIRFFGGTTANIRLHNFGSMFIARNCEFSYGSSNGLTVTGGGMTVLDNCVAKYNGLDGFNYHALDGVSGHVVEINCTGNNNGRGGGSNNGSSIHSSYTAVRIGGTYIGNEGANVADVNESDSWNVGCRAGESSDYKQDFMINGTSRMWLDECVSESEKGFIVRDSAVMKIRDSYAEGVVEGNVTRW